MVLAEHFKISAYTPAQNVVSDVMFIIYSSKVISEILEQNKFVRMNFFTLPNWPTLPCFPER